MLKVHDEKIPLSTDEDGVVRVAGTRVTLGCVVEMFDDGASPEQIADEYDALELDDVYAVITYYLRHQQEVQRLLLMEQKEAALAHKRVPKRFPKKLRDKLLKAKRERTAGDD
jgi:uncharacterized protein (DUF433 family)